MESVFAPDTGEIFFCLLIFWDFYPTKCLLFLRPILPSSGPRVDFLLLSLPDNKATRRGCPPRGGKLAGGTPEREVKEEGVYGDR